MKFKLNFEITKEKFKRYVRIIVVIFLPSALAMIKYRCRVNVYLGDRQKP